LSSTATLVMLTALIASDGFLSVSPSLNVDKLKGKGFGFEGKRWEGPKGGRRGALHPGKQFGFVWSGSGTRLTKSDTKKPYGYGLRNKNQNQTGQHGPDRALLPAGGGVNGSGRVAYYPVSSDLYPHLVIYPYHSFEN
jgi:hypothetical protein